MAGSSFDRENTIPLTAGQKVRLILDCFPVLVFVAVLIFIVPLSSQFFDRPISTLLPLIILFVALVMGFQAIQRLRDLISGVAVVEEDVLVYTARSGGMFSYSGTFERMGRLQITDSALFGSPAGKRYRVIYSPVSKIVWKLEPLA